MSNKLGLIRQLLMMISLTVHVPVIIKWLIGL